MDLDERGVNEYCWSSLKGLAEIFLACSPCPPILWKPIKVSQRHLACTFVIHYRKASANSWHKIKCPITAMCSKVKVSLYDYRVAAINPEFFSSYFKMTQHSWKSSDFIKVKRNLQGYILRIILFIKTAVSSNSSLDPGPRAFAGLCHGVPVEEPHHILYLLDQILGFVARLCNDTWFKFALLNIAKRVTIRRAGRPDLLLLHPRKVSLSQSSCVLLLS
jgi:hypothetical protein